MRKSVVYTSLLILLGCSSRKNNADKFPVLDTLPFVTNVKGMSQRHDPQKLFDACIDSVKKTRSGMALPAFFYDHLLDYNSPWLGVHRSYSVRQMVFDSTDNVD